MAHNARKHARPAKSKGKNNGPARQRYWASGRLEEHKVRHIMKDTELPRAVATQLWHEQKWRAALVK